MYNTHLCAISGFNHFFIHVYIQLKSFVSFKFSVDIYGIADTEILQGYDEFYVFLVGCQI